MDRLWSICYSSWISSVLCDVLCVASTWLKCSMNLFCGHAFDQVHAISWFGKCFAFRFVSEHVRSSYNLSIDIYVWTILLHLIALLHLKRDVATYLCFVMFYLFICTHHQRTHLTLSCSLPTNLDCHAMLVAEAKNLPDTAHQLPLSRIPESSGSRFAGVAVSPILESKLPKLLTTTLETKLSQVPSKPALSRTTNSELRLSRNEGSRISLVSQEYGKSYFYLVLYESCEISYYLVRLLVLKYLKLDLIVYNRLPRFALHDLNVTTQCTQNSYFTNLQIEGLTIFCIFFEDCSSCLLYFNLISELNSWNTIKIEFINSHE